jgi:hypothetical protein
LIKQKQIRPIFESQCAWIEETIINLKQASFHTTFNHSLVKISEHEELFQLVAWVHPKKNNCANPNAQNNNNNNWLGESTKRNTMRGSSLLM